MQSFVWAYGGKRLLESMLSVQGAVGWNADESFGGNLGRIMKNGLNPTIARAAIPLGLELFLGLRRRAPELTKVSTSLRPQADRLTAMIRDFSHQYKQACKRYREAMINRQAVQARLADAAIMLHAWCCTLSKLDMDLQEHGGSMGASVNTSLEWERDRAAAIHFFDLAEVAIHTSYRALYENPDDTMLAAAAAAIKHNDTLPNDQFVVPEKSPVAQGTGRPARQEGIKQFPGGSTLKGSPVHTG
jgi:hypothetical protein